MKKLKEKGCVVKLEHIKGHQDRQNTQLPEKANLNVEADKLATIGLMQKTIKPISLPLDRAQVWTNNKQITSKHTKQLREIYHSMEMYEYYQEKFKWNHKTMNCIWWEVHRKALHNLTEGKRTTILKFIHERLPCN